jgi:hypothetical protein
MPNLTTDAGRVGSLVTATAELKFASVWLKKSLKDLSFTISVQPKRSRRTNDPISVFAVQPHWELVKFGDKQRSQTQTVWYISWQPPQFLNVNNQT